MNAGYIGLTMTLLRTDRLTLQPSGPAHAAAVAGFLQANDAHLAPWSPIGPLGFKVEGYAYDYLLINGRWEDHVLTSLTNPAWTPPDA